MILNPLLAQRPNGLAKSDLTPKPHPGNRIKIRT